MPVRVITRFCGALAKSGHSAAECEDRACATDRSFALSDGASESSYSHMWARILAESFCEASAVEWGSDQVRDWLTDCRGRWREWERGVAARELPWFTRHTLGLGSFATFIGLSFRLDDSGAWTAVLCGDACGFLVRDDQLVLSFPIAASADFSNTPPLLATSGELTLDRLHVITGMALPGDRMYLASDALAQWFLAEHERGGRPWIACDGVSTEEDLALFASRQRHVRAMRNDDVALISLEVAADV